MNKDTLYDKMLAELKQTLNFETAGCKGFGCETILNGQEEVARAVTNLAIHAQIDLLGKQNEKLGKQRKELNDIFNNSSPSYSERIRLNGKLEGIKLAIENNRQEIQELELQ